MNNNDRSSRRDFLKTSGLMTAGATLATGLTIGRSANAAGSDLIKVALVGCGGRGRGAAVDRLKVGDNIKIVAVADAFEKSVNVAVAGLHQEIEKDGNGAWKNKIDLPEERCFSGLDGYKKAMDCLSPGDEVLIATPPGFRPSFYRYAVEKGLHVFMEKPCCTDAPGFRSLMETNKMADEKNLKICVGLQRRYDPGFQKWIEQIHAGVIGDVIASRVYWNSGQIWCRHREPGEGELAFQVKNWYHFVWLCGDNISEQHIHNLDMGLWMHSKGDKMCHPVECNAMGGRQNRIDSRHEAPPFSNRAEWDKWYASNKKHFSRHGQAWDHFFCEYTFADGSKMFSQCRHINNCFNAVEQHIHGTKGSGGSEVRGSGWLNDALGKKIYSDKVSSGGFALEHVLHANAIREDKPMNYGWNGALSSMTAVLGREAAFHGKAIQWDELVAKGKTYFPTDGLTSWNANPPVMPDNDGFYESSVAKEGEYNPFA